MSNLLIKAIIPSSVSPNEDTVSNGFSVSTLNPPSGADLTALATATEQFYTTAHSGQTTPLMDYMSGDLSTASNASTINIYDVSTSLSGVGIGSPVAVVPWTFSATTTGSTNLDPRLAACIAVRANYGSALEHGASISLPSDDHAVDEGAPATHTGTSRPRARKRGRYYIGPLNSFAVTQTHSAEIVWQTQFAIDVVAALAGYKNALSGLTNKSTLSVWSRSDAAFYSVLDYFLDESPSTQRRRGDVTRFRVHNWAVL